MPVMPTLTKSVKNLTLTTGYNYSGNLIEYTIIVKNNAVKGSLWSDVVVTDPIPSGFDFDVASIKINGVVAGSRANYNAGILTVDFKQY